MRWLLLQQVSSDELLVILANYVLDSNRVVNVPLQYIAKDLGFAGNALIQGTASINSNGLIRFLYLVEPIVVSIN